MSVYPLTGIVRPYAWLWTVPYPTKGLLVEYTQALELIVLKELGKMPQ